MENNISLSKQFNALVNSLKKLVISKGLINLTIDSREANAHTIFVALKGHHVDGRDFIPKAVDQGCTVIFKSAESTAKEDLSKVEQIFIHSNEVINGNYVEVFEIYDLERYLSFISLKFFDYLLQIANPESLGLDIPVIGVTGTNGKTLTSSMIAQGLKLAYSNRPAYVIGTVGYGPYPDLHKAKNTTPDPASVMREIFHAQLAKASALVMEVSSHGLALNRVRNVRFSQALFTNLTQDHLDYHKTMEEYFQAKAQFFTSHNVQDYIITCNGEDDDYGARLVEMVSNKLCVEDPEHEHVRGVPAYMAASMALTGSLADDHHLAGAFNSRPNPLGEGETSFNLQPFLFDTESKILKLEEKSRIAVVNIGEKVDQLVSFKADIVTTLNKINAHPHGLTIDFTFEDKNEEFKEDYTIRTSLIGTFNAYNLLMVFTSLYMHGLDRELLLTNLPQLCAVSGRMQLIPNDQNKTIIVDFAHTPDALEKVLASSKEHFTDANGKLWVVFGCGGDRDAKKRPIMGKIAYQHADRVVITDDNPRSEDPQTIANEILAACEDEQDSQEVNKETCTESEPRALYVPGREQALQYVLDHSSAGDMIIVAGKGHETEQILHDQVLHFSDQETLLELLRKASN